MKNLSLLDFIVVGCGIALLCLIGIVKGEKNKSTNLIDFSLASRKSSVLLSTFSFVASEISAMTIVGVPAVSFKDNWHYLEFFIGSAFSRIIIAYFFIPVFYRYDCITIYDFIGKRFNKTTQYVSSIFFLITRLLASGIRLYATSLAISSLTGIDLLYSIIIFILISFLFIGRFGMSSVLYTGFYQAISFYLMGIMIILFVFLKGGFDLHYFFTTVNYENKLSILNLSFNFKDPDIFLLAILNGTFGSLASFGTDYEMMQRLLTLKTRRESQKSIVYTIIATSILVIIYLLVGTSIYVFLKANSIAYTDNPDKIVPYFASSFLPDGMKGFVFLTIFLASIDLPLLSLSTSFINDIYLKLKKVENFEIIKYTKYAMLIFAILLGVIAFFSKNVEGMLWFAFEINGVTSGSLLGVFLLGIFSGYKENTKAVVISMIFSSLTCLLFMILNRLKITAIPWSSFVIIGTLLSFSLPPLIGLVRKLSSILRES